MTNILVAYTTNSGSTEEVARAIGDELSKGGAHVYVRPVEETGDLDLYQAVVVGGPMILGWHRGSADFLRSHRAELAAKPVAYFATAMSLTAPEPATAQPVPLFLDPGLVKAPQTTGRLSLKERYASVANYLGPMIKAAPDVHPLSVAFFGGRMDMYRLKWYQLVFVLLVVGAKPGDLRSWPAIRGWAAGLLPAFTAGG